MHSGSPASHSASRALSPGRPPARPPACPLQRPGARRARRGGRGRGGAGAGPGARGASRQGRGRGRLRWAWRLSLAACAPRRPQPAGARSDRRRPPLAAVGKGCGAGANLWQSRAPRAGALLAPPEVTVPARVTWKRNGVWGGSSRWGLGIAVESGFPVVTGGAPSAARRLGSGCWASLWGLRNAASSLTHSGKIPQPVFQTLSRENRCSGRPERGRKSDAELSGSRKATCKESPGVIAL